MTARVYLSGPITGRTFEEATGWREWVALRLHSGIVATDPMRGKAGLKERMAGEVFGNPDAYCDLPNCDSIAILTRDRYDVMHSDALLVLWDDTGQPSVGTLIEMGWADAARIPVVFVGWPGGHPLMSMIPGWIVDSLEDAVSVLNELLAPQDLHDVLFAKEE